jgi:hypothetical protein
MNQAFDLLLFVGGIHVFPSSDLVSVRRLPFETTAFLQIPD